VPFYKNTLSQVTTAFTPTFVELPIGSYSLNIYTSTQAAKILNSNNVNIGALSLAPANFSVQFTVAANKQSLGVITSSFSGTFAFTAIDVTPSTTNSTEQQIVNLFQAGSTGANVAFSLFQTVTTNQPISSGGTNTTTICNAIGTFSPNNGNAQVQLATPVDSTTPIAYATSSSACGSATPFLSGAPSITLSSLASGTCGRRVTVLVGRAASLTTHSCPVTGTSQLLNVTTCSSVSVQVANPQSFVLGDLQFVNQTFADVTPPVGQAFAFQFDVPACDCVDATSMNATQRTCDTCAILDAINAVGGQQGEVLRDLHGINNTVRNTINIVKSIQQKVQRKL